MSAGEHATREAVVETFNNGDFTLDLGGKTGVVTGASSGIGVGIARAMVRAGAQVVLVGRDEQRLRAAAAGLEPDAEYLLVTADVAAEDGPRRIVEEAVGAFGAIDCLVHNAGICLPESFVEAGPDSLDEQYAVNVRSPYVLTQAALPHMRPGSSIVLMGSNVAQAATPTLIAYATSKGALEAMGRNLAAELASHQIRVNVIAPGIIRTPMTARLFEDPETEAALLEHTPVGRFGTIEDIAGAVVYLCSDLAGYVNGAVLTIDGGYSIH